MKRGLEALVARALETLRNRGDLPLETTGGIVIERTRDPSHGDFACPVALGLARPARRNPRELAGLLVAALPPSDDVEKVNVAGPGFINFAMTDFAFQRVAEEIVHADGPWGRSDRFAGKRAQVEFVSSNPTGPLHVGHGRGAAYGSTVANLLESVGWTVEREYYVNDAGRQMDILALSVWLRYLDLAGHTRVNLPAGAYQGAYIADIARGLARAHGNRLSRPFSVPPLSPSEDEDTHLDRLIDAAREALGGNDYQLVVEAARTEILDDIRQDLSRFGVHFDRWFSERSLTNGAVARALDILHERGETYRRDGALWFRSTAYGDEKDRVLVRENGQSTYFASDVAYHLDKFDRGFDRVIDVWGADHHGYIARVKGAIAALGKNADAFEVLLVQLANLRRGDRRISMSTRSGEFIPLASLLDEVGSDAARFIYVLRKSDQQLDFDLDLAKSKSNENPVYYVQYAHARICSVIRRAGEPRYGHVGELAKPHEMELLKTLSRYPEVIESAANACEPHQLAHYLREVATAFHGYYNAHTILVDDQRVQSARLTLCEAARRVLADGLGLLGVGAPATM